MNEKNAEKIMEGVTKTYNSISKEFSDTRAFAGKEFGQFADYLKPGQTILDLGCGNGRLLKFLERESTKWHRQAFNYIGVDSSKNLLAEAHRQHPSRSFKQGDMTKIPIKDNTVNILFCIRAFHHLPTKNTRLKALKEMQRVLKPNGIIIITVWNLWQKKYVWQLAKAILRSIVTLGNYASNDTFIPWGKEKKPRYYHAFTLRELGNISREAKLKTLELSQSDKETKTHDLILIAKK